MVEKKENQIVRKQILTQLSEEKANAHLFSKCGVLRAITINAPSFNHTLKQTIYQRKNKLAVKRVKNDIVLLAIKPENWIY